MSHSPKEDSIEFEEPSEGYSSDYSEHEEALIPSKPALITTYGPDFLTT